MPSASIVLLTEIAAASRRLAETASRLQKIEILTEVLRRAGVDEIAIAVNYLVGRLTQGRIGLGAAALRAAGTSDNSAHAQLTLTAVDRAFADIAAATGAGSARARADLLGALFARATRDEREFLVRLIAGELRQGALEGIMIDAIARAADAPAASVRRAAMLAGDIAHIAHAVWTGGAAALSAFRLQLMRPLQPMLAQPAADMDEIYREWPRAALEYKMDGARVQVHKDGGTVRVFTRSLLDVTDAVPEVVAAAAALPVATAVLDGEAIALKADGTPHAFQTSMRRFGRKHDDAAQREALPLSVFFFDCLHIDGEDLLLANTEERFAALAAIAPSALLTPRLVSDDVNLAQRFFAQALAAGHEGIMAKTLAAPYEAGQRGGAWRKLKRSHTLDLVVLAAEWGNGRRRGWLSNLHLGARDPIGGEFVMLGKTFKGMTDAMLVWQTERLQSLKIAEDGNVVHVRPELVVEIAFNDVQASPIYPGGFALRFARVKRYREDKSAADADTLDTVRALYLAQSGAQAV